MRRRPWEICFSLAFTTFRNTVNTGRVMQPYYSLALQLKQPNFNFLVFIFLVKFTGVLLTNSSTAYLKQ